ncbi:MAG: hypothetical protein P4L56_18555 [Candidatus Sulfopaludibacter sp.]|nr:hypothetical protein [Candidatus Sulfopaludibacter sp.]
MKTKLLALLFLAGTSVFAGPRFFFGVGAGYAPAPVAVYAPPPAPVVSYYAPPAPGPGYTYVSGYYAPVGRRWAWHGGYWARPPYARSYWVAPRYYHSRYFGGYWHR